MTLTLCILLALYLSLIILNSITSFYILFEIACTGILTSIFCFVWHTYPVNSREINLIGIGSFILITNNILFLYLFNQQDLFFHTHVSPADLELAFNTIERLARTFILFISFINVFRFKPNKWHLFTMAIFISVLIPLAIHISIVFHTKFNFLYVIFLLKESIVLKTIISAIIISLLLFIIYTAYRNLKYKNSFYPRPIILSLLTILAHEICFTTGTLSTGYFFIAGYFFKIFSYYCLCKGILTYKPINIDASLNEPLGKNMMEVFNMHCCGVVLFNKDFRLIFINNKLEKILGCKLEDIYGLHIESILRKFKITDLNLIPIISLADVELEYESEPDKKSYIISLINCNNEKIILSVKYYYMSNDTFLLTLTRYDSFHNLMNYIDKEAPHTLDPINSFIIIADKNNKVIFCNMTFKTVTGMDPSKAIGMTAKGLCKLLNLKFGKIDSIGKKYINSRLKTREAIIDALDGQKKHIMLQFTPIKNHGNKNNGYIITGSDITLLKQQQQNIQQQEKLAIIGQLGSGIVHEAKNMLSSIKGYCQLLYLKSHNEYVKNTAKKIDDITSEINRTIEEFLTLSKPASRNFKVVYLNNIILSVKYMLESPSFIEGIKVQFKLADHEKPIYADELQIKQVILNMSKNAIEAMSCTVSPKLEISTSLSNSHEHMILSISDNGKGLDKEDLGKLGTPFFTTKENGTGLGLSTCYRIIEEHRGKIEVESEIGKGTKFSIFLPCAPVFQVENNHSLISLN